MKPFQKILTLALSLSITTYMAKAQTQPLAFVNGKIINETEYANVIGTPYLSEKWLPGIVTFADNRVVQLPVKLDLKDDEPCFKNEKGETVTFADRVKSVVIKDGGKANLFRKGYINGPGITPDNYVEVIADGKTQFLKKLSKSIVESKDYTSSITNKRFLDVTKYYVYNGDKIIQVKKDTKSILAVLTDKHADIQKYVADNKLNLKNDDDIIKAFSYYNTL